CPQTIVSPARPRREPHRQIEKRRRDKMNNLIDELSAMIPACMARKLDKLTVLRKAVQHLKALKAGTSNAFTDTACKPYFLPHDDLRHLLLRDADGFLLVVSCDRAKILFISESVCKILNFSQLELTGQSLFDFIHHKDINKVKEQLSSSELYPRQRLIDAATGAQLPVDAPVGPSNLSTGARRSFFCRMKHSRTAGKAEDSQSLPSTSKKKDSHRYCTLHCTGYMRSWPSSQLEAEGDGDKEPSSLTCLVTVCRLLPHVSHQPPKDVQIKPTEFVTRCAIDGKFTFVDQQATPIIGYLPQEVLGTSCYEYFHQDDLQHLAEKHRQALHTKEKVETQSYKFKTKHGSYVHLQSQWSSFTNPWTKEVEFIVSSNRVVSGGFKALQGKTCTVRPAARPDGSERDPHCLALILPDDSKQIPVIPGLSSGVGPMIYAGSIGTQIANELIEPRPRSDKAFPLPLARINSSPSSGASSPFGPVREKSPLVSPQAGKSVSEPSQLELDSMVVPGLSSFSSDEAAMAVIMSLLETDVNMSQSGDFEEMHWPF
uniref:Aryl hydrocarbon receptor nuclear translocator like 2 n=1 Tax=Salarias fasciatus TaxID=181472 RepID=A0A672GUY4_SALFA